MPAEERDANPFDRVWPEIAETQATPVVRIDPVAQAAPAAPPPAVPAPQAPAAQAPVVDPPVPEPAPAPAPASEPAPSAPADTPGDAKATPKVAARPAPRPKDPRRGRRLRRVLIALALVLIVAAGGLGWWGYSLSRQSFPQTSGTLKIPGLAGSVEVVRDSHGIPQVYADTPEDLFRAQGFVQAQDRFWQMDVARHYTSGTLSEMFGSGQMKNDIFLRTLGWRRVAEQEYTKLAPDTQRYLQAFSDGVNAYLKGKSGDDISFEYSMLGFVHDGYKPAQWTPVDSVSWLKAMAWDLRSNLQDEIDRALMSSTLTVNQIDDLYPPYPYDRNQPIVTSGTVVRDPKTNTESFSQAAAPPTPSKTAQNALADLAQTLQDLPSLFTDSASGVGSNSWVVSGAHTTTGKPLMANDPHLSASLPSVWYQMGLHCRTVSAACPYDDTGYTFPGMPGVVIGHNQSISWGFTNMGADVTDLYLEKVNDTGYLYDGQYLPFTDVHTEVIKSIDGPSKTITVRSTQHGPIVSDADDDLKDVGKVAPIPDPGPQREGGFAVALRWTALDPGTTMDSVFQLDRATDWNSFRDALRNFDVPAQNVIYADVNGNIGYQAPGRIPIRQSGDGAWPVYGWDPKYEWTGYIPFDSLPNVFNPPSGYIVTANQPVTDPTYPYLLTTDWDYGYRSQRITDMLNADFSKGQKIDAAEMQRMQSDQTSPIAQILVPYLLKVQVNDPWVRQAQNLLKGWDYTQPADSKPAAYFNAVWRNVLKLAFGDRLPFSVRATSDCGIDPTTGQHACGTRDDATAQPDGGERWFEVVNNLLPDAESPWWNISTDPGKITTRDGLLSKAMSDARKELTAKLGKDMNTWSWGRLHTMDLKNQSLGTSGPGIVKWVLNRNGYQLGGGEGLVDATGWNAAQGYQATTVPSMRMVVDLSNFDNSRWIDLTGASGHVYDAHYTDQTGLWVDGKTLSWPYSKAAVDKARADTLTLVPSGAPATPAQPSGPSSPPGPPPGSPTPSTPASPSTTSTGKGH